MEETNRPDEWVQPLMHSSAEEDWDSLDLRLMDSIPTDRLFRKLLSLELSIMKSNCLCQLCIFHLRSVEDLPCLFVFKTSLFSTGRRLFQCQTLSDFFLSLLMNKSLLFLSFFLSFTSDEVSTPQKQERNKRGAALSQGSCTVYVSGGPIKMRIAEWSFIWPASQLLRRNRISNSGAASRSVSNDECPVRVN